MEVYDLDPILGLLALPHANDIDFSVTDEPDWFPFNIEGSFVYDQRAFPDSKRSATTHLAVPARYRNEWRDDVIGFLLSGGIRPI